MAGQGLGEIVAMEAVALAGAIRARQVSCVEVMGAYLDHITAANPPLNAIIAMRERADLLAEAAAHDAALARGDPVGPLHGLPHAMKDLTAVKGLPFTQGSPLFRDQIAAEDSIQAERLRAAGVIFIGKTNTPEFGLGSHTFNPVWGVTRNPYDPRKSAGGSSGGAAVALAARMLPLADGSDYGGSLRNPAGWNNVLGFRTSYGRVPNHVRDDWIPTMGVAGPMARTVADLALLLSVQAGYDARAPLSLEGDGSAFLGPLETDVAGRRIGWLGDFGGAAPCDPEVLSVCGGAMRALEDLGCVVEDALPAYPLDKAWSAFQRLRHWQAGAGFAEIWADPARRAQLKPEAAFEVEAGLRLSAFDVFREFVVRSEWAAAVRALFARFDYLAAPTAQVFPFDVETHWPREVAGVTMATYHEWMKGNCLISLGGCPSLAMPAGFGAAGLPIGIQIIAPVHAETACLQLALAYEQATRWVEKRPPQGVRTP